MIRISFESTVRTQQQIEAAAKIADISLSMIKSRNTIKYAASCNAEQAMHFFAEITSYSIDL